MTDEFEIELIEEDNLDVSLENSVVKVVENDYEKLINQPQINNVTLTGNKSLDDLNIQKKGSYADERITNLEIDALFN